MEDNKFVIKIPEFLENEPYGILTKDEKYVIWMSGPSVSGKLSDNPSVYDIDNGKFIHTNVGYPDSIIARTGCILYNNNDRDISLTYGYMRRYIKISISKDAIQIIINMCQSPKLYVINGYGHLRMITLDSLLFNL